MKSISRRAARALFAWGAASALAISLGAAEPLFPDPVVARGKGFEIKRSELDEMYLAFRTARSAQGQRVPEANRARVQADILDKLIATRLCLQHATAEDKAKAGKFAEEFIAAQMKQAGSPESFERQIRAAGMEPQLYRDQIAEQAVVKEVLERELKSRETVTPADIKKFYDENPALFQEPDLVRVAHVLVSTQDANGRELTGEALLAKRKLAEKILERAQAREDFAKLVKDFSDDKNAKDGEYTFGRARETPDRAMTPEFEGAAFSLAVNQVSDLVRTRYGYHVIKLLEKIPARKAELASVSDRIKETLLQERVQAALPGFIEKLKKDAGVVKLDPDSGQ